MSENINICIKIDNNAIYKFLGKMNEKIMIKCANEIELLLLENSVQKDKIQNVFELFIETIQNILCYSYTSSQLKLSHKEASCNFFLDYISNSETYILESFNFIDPKNKKIIEEKIKFLKDFDDNELRKLIRQKSRSKEDSHIHGAGLGYIIMARKSSGPIKIKFIPYEKGILIYNQKLFI